MKGLSLASDNIVIDLFLVPSVLFHSTYLIPAIGVEPCWNVSVMLGKYMLTVHVMVSDEAVRLHPSSSVARLELCWHSSMTGKGTLGGA